MKISCSDETLKVIERSHKVLNGTKRISEIMTTQDRNGKVCTYPYLPYEGY